MAPMTKFQETIEVKHGNNLKDDASFVLLVFVSLLGFISRFHIPPHYRNLNWWKILPTSKTQNSFTNGGIALH